MAVSIYVAKKFGDPAGITDTGYRFALAKFFWS